MFMIDSHTQVLRGRKLRTISSLFILCCVLALFVSVWLHFSGSKPQTTFDGGVRANGFGSAANHVHSLLVLPNNVLVLATHYGLFRSSDAGKTWSTVAAGPQQVMDGLMTASLTACINAASIDRS